MTFWNDLPRPFFALAPMEAVTDIVFRSVIDSVAPPDLYFSEFTNATGWTHAGQKAIGGRLEKRDNEQPIIAQIWGGEPGDMEQLAHHCRELGFAGIDLNMGCPAKSAVKSGGAALILHPELAAESIAAAKLADLPVSVKTRLGYSKADEWRDWLSHLLRQDIVNLTLHLRSKQEMSKVEAHHELIPEIVALRDKIAPKTLFTVNGDIRDRAHGLEIAQKYPGVDGVMIGRGIFQNPFAFEHETREHPQGELIDLLEFHLDQYDKYNDVLSRPYETLKRYFKIYIRDFDGANDLRTSLMSTHDTKEARSVLQGFSRG